MPPTQSGFILQWALPEQAPLPLGGFGLAVTNGGEAVFQVTEPEL
jgi:hypothetical protein